MATSTLPIFFFFMLSSGIITCMIVGVYGDHTAPHFSRKHSYHSHLPNLFLERDSASPIPPPAPASTPSSVTTKIILLIHLSCLPFQDNIFSVSCFIYSAPIYVYDPHDLVYFNERRRHQNRLYIT